VEGNSSREVEVLVLILFTEAFDASYIQNPKLAPPHSELLRRNQRKQTDKSILTNRRKETDRTT
jgi:hypothetical protein